jgi:hypothetical protein
MHKEVKKGAARKTLLGTASFSHSHGASHPLVKCPRLDDREKIQAAGFEFLVLLSRKLRKKTA